MIYASTEPDDRRAVAAASRALLCLLLGLGIGMAVGCERIQREPIRISGPAQGTTFNVTITQPPEQVSAGFVRSAMRSVIDTIDRQMSTWREDSELSRFNAAPVNTWVPVSAPLAELTRTALAIGRETGGAFDVTLGPILSVWGFGADAERPLRVPTTDEVEAARENTGVGLIDVRTDPPALRKTREGVILDLAGIAQGYTVDRMARRLDNMGVQHYLVELGGELFARGDKNDGEAWRIGVEKPQAGARVIDRVIGLKNAGMTTSGDYREFFEIDGRRFSHTIDPRTGRPVAHNLHAVTVIVDDATTADAMATALLVMGPDAGLAFANRHDIAALFVSGNEGAYNRSMSKAFEPYFEDS